MTNTKAPVEHQQDSYGLRPEAKEFPMMCVLSFTYVCNARCPNCPYTNSSIRADYRDRPFMQPETFRRIADECGAHGAWVRISGGGEPMLHPEAVDLVEYAKTQGAKVGLITNGSRFTEHSTHRLLAAGVDMMEFSVDACDPETYNRVRPGLDWETLQLNVRRMVNLRNELRSPTRVIASVINQEGVDVDAVTAFWEPIVDQVQKRKYLTWGINDPSRSADPTPYLPTGQHVPCPFLFERLNIDSRGKVMVCGFDIAAKTDLGNIHERSIRDIWLGDGFAAWRRAHLEGRIESLPLCRDCPDLQYRSWRHNYWKLASNAGARRDSRLGLGDSEGHVEDQAR